MFEIFHTIFKYREKESPDQLGLYPERVHVNAMPERRYLWTSRILVILAAISMSITMMLALTIYLLVPQKTVYPRILQINKYFSELELVQNDEVNTRATDLLAEQHITDYIILRNTITNDYDELMSRWGPGEIVYWFSAKPVYEAFYRGDVTHNIMQFKEKGLQRFVKVEWVRPLTMGLWQVQYLTMDLLPGATKPDTKIWRATMRITYVKIPFTKREDAIANPFGFIVRNYSLAYHGTPETSAHYLETVKKETEDTYRKYSTSKR